MKFLNYMKCKCPEDEGRKKGWMTAINDKTRIFFWLEISGGGGDISTYHLTGTCHFARKIGTHNSINSGGFLGHNSVNRMKIWAIIP